MKQVRSDCLTLFQVWKPHLKHQSHSEAHALASTFQEEMNKRKKYILRDVGSRQGKAQGVLNLPQEVAQKGQEK